MDVSTLTPLGLFWQAGPLVKGVILVLLAASIWCWVVIIEGVLALRKLNRAIQHPSHGGLGSDLLQPIRAAGQSEALMSYPGEGVTFAKTRIEAAMRRKASELIEQAEGGLPTLAVIASSAPFIGLFGTVWGIMTSFIGIAALKDTSLAVVAPGIAEALAATAIGLAAAIPAAVGYNRIGAALARCGRKIGRAIDEQALVFAGSITSKTFSKSGE